MNSRDLTPFIYEYLKKTNWVGGSLHIILGDSNIPDDRTIEFLVDESRNRNDLDALFILDKMKEMKKTARTKAIKNAWKLMPKWDGN